jgi:flagellar biosynthesis GTPase FlhF
VESRRFIGNDLSRLYRRVRSELGDDALIVSTRSLHRDGAPSLIEVMASRGGADALPLELQQAALTTVLSRVAPGLTVGDLEDLVLRGVLGQEYVEQPAQEEFAPAFEPTAPPEPTVSYDRSPPSSPQTPAPVRAQSTLEEQLTGAGLSELAAEMVATHPAAGSNAEGALSGYLRRLLAQYPDERQTALIMVDGPRGSGRTTALLRMALDCTEAGREAVLIAADDSHSGTVDRIAGYADVMGLHSFEAFDDEAMLRVLRRQPRGACLFVDTAPGWIAPAAAGLAQFSYLAMPAHWQSGSMKAALLDLPEGHFCGAIPTFADIVTDMSPVVSLAIESGLGLAFLSSGSDISTGIAVADPAALASGIFAKRTGETTNGRLVASA